MDELVIRVESVEEAPRRILLETSQDWWVRVRDFFQEPSARAPTPFRVDVEAYRLGERLLFRGGLAGTVELACSRCAEPYASSIPQAGIELDAQDLGLGRYAGDELNFEPVVLEILALVWPMQPLCRDECAGLCQACGRNLNTQTCACRAEPVNRPFAALARLLGSKRE